MAGWKVLARAIIPRLLARLAATSILLALIGATSAIALDTYLYYHHIYYDICSGPCTLHYNPLVLNPVTGLDGGKPGEGCVMLVPAYTTTGSRGAPVIVRGVDNVTSRMIGASPVLGNMTAAIVGSRLAGLLDIHAGDNILVYAPSTGSVYMLRVAGIQGLPGHLDWEVIVDARLAQSLRGAYGCTYIVEPGRGGGLVISAYTIASLASTILSLAVMLYYASSIAHPLGSRIYRLLDIIGIDPIPLLSASTLLQSIVSSALSTVLYTALAGSSNGMLGWSWWAALLTPVAGSVLASLRGPS